MKLRIRATPAFTACDGWQPGRPSKIANLSEGGQLDRRWRTTCGRLCYLHPDPPSCMTWLSDDLASLGIRGQAAACGAAGLSRVVFGRLIGRTPAHEGGHFPSKIPRDKWPPSRIHLAWFRAEGRFDPGSSILPGYRLGEAPQ